MVSHRCLGGGLRPPPFGMVLEAAGFGGRWGRPDPKQLKISGRPKNYVLKNMSVMGNADLSAADCLGYDDRRSTAVAKSHMAVVQNFRSSSGERLGSLGPDFGPQAGPKSAQNRTRRNQNRPQIGQKPEPKIGLPNGPKPAPNPAQSGPNAPRETTGNPNVQPRG